MKAWQVVDPSGPRAGVRIRELERRRPGPGEVLIGVRAAALGFPDYLLASGLYHDRPEVPFTLGGEAAGVVEEAGSDVVNVAVGDRVIVVPGETVTGYLAEEVVLAKDLLLPLPDEMPFLEGAALFVAYHTAHLGLFRRGRLRRDETLLVLGAAGGVGSAAVQLASAAGSRVIAVVGGDYKASYVADIGADHIVDHTQDDVVKAVRALTGERGVDVVFDPVGGEAFHQARRVVAVEGRLVVVGFASGEVAQAPTNHALLKNYDIVGFRTRPFRDDPTCRREIHDDLVTLYRDGRLQLPVHRVPWDGVIDALESIGQRRVFGRLVVDVSDRTGTTPGT